MIIPESDELLQREFHREWQKIPRFLRFTRRKRNIVIAMIPIFIVLGEFISFFFNTDVGDKSALIHFPYVSLMPAFEIHFPMLRVALTALCFIMAIFCFLWLLVGKSEEKKAHEKACEYVRKCNEWEHEQTMKEYHEALKMNEDYYR